MQLSKKFAQPVQLSKTFRSIIYKKKHWVVQESWDKKVLEPASRRNRFTCLSAKLSEVLNQILHSFLNEI